MQNFLFFLGFRAQSGHEEKCRGIFQSMLDDHAVTSAHHLCLLGTFLSLGLSWKMICFCSLNLRTLISLVWDKWSWGVMWNKAGEGERESLTHVCTPACFSLVSSYSLLLFLPSPCLIACGCGTMLHCTDHMSCVWRTWLHITVESGPSHRPQAAGNSADLGVGMHPQSGVFIFFFFITLWWLTRWHKEQSVGGLNLCSLFKSGTKQPGNSDSHNHSQRVLVCLRSWQKNKRTEASRGQGSNRVPA